MLHIVLHALHVYPGETGGGETYLRELAKALSALDTRHHYTVLIWPEAESLIQPLCQHNFDYHIVARNMARRLRRRVLRHLIAHRTGWLANVPADVMHWTNSVVMLTPFRMSVPSVLTMMDIQHEYLPENFTPDDLRLRRSLFPESIRRARRVITLSEFTRRTLIERYDTDATKIDVIYPGVNRSHFGRIISDDERTRLRQRHHLPVRFLLYPAGTWPHKNHLRLLEALAHIAQPEIKIILTGIRQRNHEAVLQAIADHKLTEQVRHIGHATWDDMPGLYQCADGMIFPSLFEGFGLPVIEAMAAGCPAAVADVTALPEIGGEAVLYFDPHDTEAIADSIYRLWHDVSLRHDLRQRGYAHRQRFDWHDHARQMIAIYEQM